MAIANSCDPEDKQNVLIPKFFENTSCELKEFQITTG